MSVVGTEQTASSAVWVRALLDLFASQGVEIPRLLDAAGIGRASVLEPHARFDLQQVNRLWQLAVAASGQQTLGLDRGLASRFVNFEIAGQSIGSGASLWTALESLTHYLALTNDAAAFTLQREHPNAWMAFTHGNDASFPRQRLEYGMLAMLIGCRQATRRPLRPLAADFVFPEPADVHRHRMAFPCPLRFDRPANRLLFAAADLELPVAPSSPSASVLQERVLESLLAGLGAARTSFRVSQELVRRLHRGSAAATGAIAAAIGLTEDALARQLRAERTTVERLLDRVQREMAREYLAGSRFPLEQMPALLGLHDAADFAAACLRWFDETAADYRLHHGPDLPRRRPGTRPRQAAGEDGAK